MKPHQPPHHAAKAVFHHVLEALSGQLRQLYCCTAAGMAVASLWLLAGSTFHLMTFLCWHSPDRSVALDHSLVASGSSDNVVRLWHARHATDGSSLLDPAAAAAAAELPAADLDDASLAAFSTFLDMDGPADSALLPAVPAALTPSGGAAVLPQAAEHPVQHSFVTGDADESLFDLSLPGQHLRGHIGPVTSLCLNDSCLYSGSWDYTVRCWRRGSWDCIR